MNQEQKSARTKVILAAIVLVISLLNLIVTVQKELSLTYSLVVFAAIFVVFLVYLVNYIKQRKA